MKNNRFVYPLHKLGIFFFASLSSISLSLALSPAFAEDSEHYLSVVPGGVAKTPVKAVSSTPAKNPTTVNPKTPATTAVSPTKPNADLEASPDQSASTPDGSATETPPPTKSFYSAALEQAVRAYRSAPSGQTYSAVLGALRSSLAASGNLRLSPALLAKDNPYLNDFKPRVLDANGVRLWTFPKATERNRALLQWFDVHQTVVGVGRRKKVVSSATVRFQEMQFSRELNVKDAGMVTVKDSGRRLLIAGDGEDGSLQIQAYKMTESGWQEESDFMSQLPPFLSNNVSGRIGFRGSDLVFNVGRMITVTDASGTKRLLPEAESATYKYLLKNTDSGYQVSASIADEDPFSAVFQFMQAVAQSRNDVMRACLADPKSQASTLSIPKYLGLQGHAIDSATKVVEMSVPAGRGSRYRLINMGKDDLIFDVGKVKGQWLIKAIYIAPPDPFLAETAKYYPHFSKFEQKQEVPKDPSETGAGSSPPSIKRK